MEPITLETIREHCGYENLNNLRQIWNVVFKRAIPFPEKSEAIPTNQLIALLKRVAAPYPNKSQEAIQGALKLLEGIPIPDQYEPITVPAHNGTAKPERKRQTTPKPSGTLQEQAQAERIRQQAAAEQQQREMYSAIQEENRKRRERMETEIMPWVNGLTWALNYLEMSFLVIGLWYVAGYMGAIVGGFIIVLGSIILLLVQMKGQAAGYAVFAWFLICCIGGWLVEYPAMLMAILNAGTILDGGTTYAGIEPQKYAMLVTAIMSGSSFAGTFFRYKKSAENEG